MGNLLIPRVIVTNLYPDCPFEVREILTYTDGYVRLGEIYSDMIEGNQEWVTKSDVEKSPANFRKLGWWEERKPEELPEYVKYVFEGKVCECDKVIGWDKNYAIFEYYPDGVKPKSVATFQDECLQPATEQDYLTFKQIKK